MKTERYPYAWQFAWEGSRTWWQVKLLPESELFTCLASSQADAINQAEMFALQNEMERIAML